MQRGRRRVQPLLPSAAQRRRPAQAQRTDRGLDPRGRDAGRADQGDRHRRALRAAYHRRADGGRGQARVSRADRRSTIAIAATTISRSRSRRPTSRATARSDPPRRTIPTTTCAWSRSAPTASWCAAPRSTPRVSTNTNEVIVLPTRAMRAEDKAYAVAFALPINTPGLKLIASPHGSAHKEPVRASDQRAAQDDGDADRLRRRVRAQGARVPATARSISPDCSR